MTKNPQITAFVTCQNDYCAEEISYPLDMVRLWKGQPICESCWIDGDYRREEVNLRWDDLPRVKLEYLVEEYIP